MKPRRLTILLNPEFFALAENLANDAGKTMSDFIRALIAEKLREKSIFYDPALLKMPQGKRTDLATPRARKKFGEKMKPQLERARAARSAKKNHPKT